MTEENAVYAKQACLDYAIRSQIGGEVSPEKVLETAKGFYAWVSGGPAEVSKEA